MRNPLTLLSLALCLGIATTSWAAPLKSYHLKEGSLLRDPAMQGENLSPILLGMQWFAEQQALRSQMLFPREVLEADVPMIGPRWVPNKGSNGL
ncbi:hypothetical protein [Vampirovibrio sp.]|uniref:hypothetical protein n=1 Tax=Vampirovibrio sp. TaxID=2717857 RepID=UPI003592EFFD